MYVGSATIFSVDHVVLCTRVGLIRVIKSLERNSILFRLSHVSTVSMAVFYLVLAR